ncbi:putative terminase, large subunit [Ralstonia phage RP12]|uniref:Putative terminase, large subunit n=1 Tax=Ralstonia phage RP12 TaxID=1923889 RepID=A0A1L7N0L2_9CAUD|nr:terminase large subunit [Ralstonia phage RP12]BAW18998.1 putative terminase, large subunit [Ralstonia phage RP12]
MAILFMDDWKRYPSAIVDTETKNKSYLRLAVLYRSLGVKNHAFLLALVNPALRGVDPHSLSLSETQKAMIALECAINPWYYFREVAKAPAIGGGDAVMQEANRGNIALYWLFFNHVMTFLIQIRQTGKSFSTDSLMTYLMNIGCRDTEINLLTKDDNLRRGNINRLKDIAAELPSYLNQQSRDDASNTEEITRVRLKNRYKTHVPQMSPKRALNLGRGLTSGIFHIDEGPFQPNIAIALPAALAATGAAVDRAKKAGAYYGTILTTTAGKKDDKDGAFIYKMVSQSAVWSEKFFDAMNEAALYEIIRKASPKGKLRVNITLNHRQLGKTDQWLMEKLEESVQTGDDANRDYFNMWTSGSQTSPLSTTILNAIRNSVRGSDHTDISRISSYTTRWYLPEDQISKRMFDSTYVMGCDSSNASGGDDCAFYVMDTQTLETVCVANINETNLIHLSKWIAAFLIKYPSVTFIPENRSSGQSIIDYLLIELSAVGINPFKRIYNTVVQDKQVNEVQYEEMQRLVSRNNHDQYARFKKTFGFTTSGGGTTSRSALYSETLQLAAKRSCDRVYDKVLADQINGLITKNGRVDHPPGEHDDMCIAWLLAHWMITKAKNLRYYGIDPSLVGSLLNDSGDGMDPQQADEKREQRVIRERINALADKIAQAKDLFVIVRLEQEMRALSSRVVVEENEVFNVDNLIREAKERKRTDRAASSTGSNWTRRNAVGSWNGYTELSGRRGFGS